MQMRQAWTPPRKCYVDSLARDACSLNEGFQRQLSSIQRLGHVRFSFLDKLPEGSALIARNSANQFLCCCDCTFFTSVANAQVSQTAQFSFCIFQRRNVCRGGRKARKALELSFERFAGSFNLFHRIVNLIGHFFLIATHLPDACPAKS